MDMKELIGTAVLIISLLGSSSVAIRKAHDEIRRAALTHVSQGLPSLTKLTAALQGKRQRH